jgi:hypothetical protein
MPKAHDGAQCLQTLQAPDPSSPEFGNLRRYGERLVLGEAATARALPAALTDLVQIKMSQAEGRLRGCEERSSAAAASPDVRSRSAASVMRST